MHGEMSEWHGFGTGHSAAPFLHALLARIQHGFHGGELADLEHGGPVAPSVRTLDVNAHGSRFHTFGEIILLDYAYRGFEMDARKRTVGHLGDWLVRVVRGRSSKSRLLLHVISKSARGVSDSYCGRSLPP